MEILGHNNITYHAQLAGDLATAHKHIKAGLTQADAHALFMPYQYLYSTWGEIALAEGQLKEADTWFKRGLSEAEKHGNRLQAANIKANLGLVARARGDLDEALVLLKDASSTVASITAPHLRIQIDLWLAELYLQRGERLACEKSLVRAERNLIGSERHSLQAWAQQIRADIDA